MTIDELGIMVKQGFDSVDKRLDKLERGQDFLMSKLDSLVYRFEHNELERRVEILEAKAGIRPA